MEQFTATRNGQPINLKRNGRDNASCPACGHYNAMLYEQEIEGGYELKCRDCGTTVQMMRATETDTREFSIGDDVEICETMVLTSGRVRVICKGAVERLTKKYIVIRNEHGNATRFHRDTCRAIGYDGYHNAGFVRLVADEVSAKSESNLNIYPSRASQVTKLLRARGINAELVRGKGYWYFAGDDVHGSSGVMVYRVADLTLQQWLNEFEDLRAEWHA